MKIVRGEEGGGGGGFITNFTTLFIIRAVLYKMIKLNRLKQIPYLFCDAVIQGEFINGGELIMYELP